MKIAIDISMAVGESAGVGTYTRGLIEGLARVDAENEYLLYTYLDVPEPSGLNLPSQPHFTFRTVPRGGDHWERLWFDAELPSKEALGQVDIIHSPFSMHQGNAMAPLSSLSTTSPSCCIHNSIPRRIGCTASMVP